MVAVHSPLAIELRLPVWLHASVHPVFHPMYLKLSTTTTVDHGLRSRLQSVFEPADYEVDGILAHRARGGGTEFLIQWANCSYLQSTWEPESGLAHAQRHLAKYRAKSRPVEVDAASVMLHDPARLGARGACALTSCMCDLTGRRTIVDYRFMNKATAVPSLPQP